MRKERGRAVSRSPFDCADEEIAMQFVMFTKLLKELDADQLADTMLDLGFDGFDLAVRPGFPVNPENVATALPAAAKKWEERGLAVGLITTNFDFLDPNRDDVEPMLGAAAEVGCREIKLGYWGYRGEDYWEKVKEIRQALSGFEAICAKYDVRVSVHTHSGAYYGSNCAGAMHLVQGFDPRAIGIYMDPGHLSLDGEEPSLAFSMVREYLSLIAVKNLAWSRQDGKWRRDVVPLREGLVDWKQIAGLIKQHGYDGVLSLHSEYEGWPMEKLLAQAREDLAYMKQLMAGAG